MEAAAQKDKEMVKKGEPAFNKIEKVDYFCRQLKTRRFQEELLERNVLSCVSLWLLPTKSRGTLPPIDIRTKLYDAIATMPVQTDHIRRSGIGRLLMELKRHKKETSTNKSKLHTIIEKWSRLVLNKTDNMRNLASEQRSLMESGRAHILKLGSNRRKEVTSPVFDKPKDMASLLSSTNDDSYDPDLNRQHARIPQPMECNYIMRPKSLDYSKHHSHQSRKPAPESQAGILKKQIEQVRKMSKTKMRRSAKMSIEGGKAK